MLEINLLPWRSLKRQRLIRHCNLIIIVVLIISMAGYFIGLKNNQAQVNSKVSINEHEINSMQQKDPLEKINYIGVLQSGVSCCALVKLPSGRVVIVYAGTKLAETNLKILAITVKAVTLQSSENKIYFLHPNFV